MKQELAEEKRAHAEIENYLKKHIEVKIKEKKIIMSFLRILMAKWSTGCHAMKKI